MLLIYSCTFSFNPTSDSTLHKQYAYTQDAGDLLIFYNVTKSNDNKNVKLSLKNKSNYFMTNVSIKITSSQSAKSNYFSLGNIKNGNSKSLAFTVPKDTNRVNVSYEYYLTREDAFLKSDSYIGQENTQTMNDEYKKTGKQTLYLK
jgi:hypothetical protein